MSYESDSHPDQLELADRLEKIAIGEKMQDIASGGRLVILQDQVHYSHDVEYSDDSVSLRIDTISILSDSSAEAVKRPFETIELSLKEILTPTIRRSTSIDIRGSIEGVDANPTLHFRQRYDVFNDGTGGKKGWEAIPQQEAEAISKLLAPLESSTMEDPIYTGITDNLTHTEHMRLMRVLKDTQDKLAAQEAA